MKTINNLLDILSKKERKQGYFMLLMILLMAFFETAGVASIAPFMAALSDPQIIINNEIFHRIYLTMGYEDTEVSSLGPDGFLFFLGGIVFMLLIISVIFKALTTYLYEKFSALVGYSVSRELVKGYLKQDYGWFLNRHSSDLGKSILTEVNAVITGALLPLMKLLSNLAVVIAMTVLLIYADPFLAVSISLVLVSVYSIVYLLLRSFIKDIGLDRVLANEERFKIIQEGFSGIKDIKVYGLEEEVIKRYEDPARRFALNTAYQHIAGQLPRFLLEAIAFGGMLFLILFLMFRYENIQEVIPLLALYVLALYRLLPALQQIYAQITQIRFTVPALEILHKDFVSLAGADTDLEENKDEIPVRFKEYLQMKDVHFSYEKADKQSLKGINIIIKPRTKVGFIGSTGSGKTTLVDVILGLFIPQKGEVLIDGTVLNKTNVRSWQRSVGYVSQNIYLSDDSISSNIGFGLSKDSIDQPKVEEVSKIANLHDFIMTLPDGYETEVGEAGVRLSGGQCQRIGIARALYNNPDVLIFDEATSALDNITEKEVMAAINNLGSDKTIIMIAHRLSTVEKCDEIFVLEGGSVVERGSYDELKETSKQFQKMLSQEH
jgi:ABC-type multidrug transport system fused ATPase/permease subunit